MEGSDAHVATQAREAAEEVSRRTVLITGTGTVLAASVVAACGGSGSETSGGSGDGSAKAGAGGSGGGSEGGKALVKVAKVPVGGAVSATGSDGKPVIVAQPAKGQVVAFSAICTHKGCTVAPAGKILKCPCHGSTYNPATGKNTGGPAPSPLSRIRVKVEGGNVVEA